MAEKPGEIVSRQFAFAIEGLEGTGDDGSGAAGRRGFPLAIAADGGDPGKNLRGDKKIGLLGVGAEEVEGDGAALADEARSELGSLSQGGGGRSQAGRTEAGFNERRSRRGKLGVARQIEAEADVIEPGGRVVEGAQRRGRASGGGLTPQRGARDL